MKKKISDSVVSLSKSLVSVGWILIMLFFRFLSAGNYVLVLAILSTKSATRLLKVMSDCRWLSRYLCWYKAETSFNKYYFVELVEWILLSCMVMEWIVFELVAVEVTIGNLLRVWGLIWFYCPFGRILSELQKSKRSIRLTRKSEDCLGLWQNLLAILGES